MGLRLWWGFWCGETRLHGRELCLMLVVVGGQVGEGLCLWVPSDLIEYHGRLRVLIKFGELGDLKVITIWVAVGFVELAGSKSLLSLVI